MTRHDYQQMSTGYSPCEWHRAPAYPDGTLVREGDAIRYRQAPGGILPRSESWTAGVAVPASGTLCVHELDLLAADGRAYILFGHEIERAS